MKCFELQTETPEGTHWRTACEIGSGATSRVGFCRPSLLDFDEWQAAVEQATGFDLWVAWSGGPKSSPFASEPTSWLPARREEFAARFDQAQRIAAERGATLAMRPCARHVLGDPQTCLAFLREQADAPAGILLDPVAMLESSMLADLGDHLRRMFASLGPTCMGVFLSGLVPERGSDTTLMRGSISEGLITPAEWAGLLQEHCPAETPVFVEGEGAALIAEAIGAS